MTEAGTGNELPMRPANDSSGWEINWPGLAAVVVIAVLGVVVWRWTGGPTDGSIADSADRPETSIESVPTAPVATAPAVPVTTERVAPAPTTVALPATTVAPPRQVIISGEMKPCKYGANCLVASFEIVGFEEQPTSFVCIYPNSRRDLSFREVMVADACLTADAGDTIAIEVEGVVSATISEANLTGT